MSKHPDFGGLAAKLFSDEPSENAGPHPVEQFVATPSPTRIVLLPVDEVRPDPDQPRKYFNDAAHAELTESVRDNGVLQPILARQEPGGAGCILIAGERRWRAAKAAGLATIPALIRETENVRELALIENLQRENLAPIDEAEAVATLKSERGYTDEVLAKVLGKSRAWVSQTVGLASLPESIRTECQTSDICSKSLLVEILQAGDAIKQQKIWDAVKDGKLTSVRAVRSEIRPKSKKPKSFQFAFKPDDASYKLTVTFKKTAASIDEIRSALTESLKSIES